MKDQKISMYLCYLLRHNPDALGLSMDQHGYVDIQELIAKINEEGRYTLDPEQLSRIVEQDQKGRYNVKDGKIAACQGHSIPWVEPELRPSAPPALLYHGTTAQAYQLICSSGAISKMQRHAVHLQAEPRVAWKSALRWKKNPVLLVIDAEKMAADGYDFGVSLNGVWCTETVPVRYIKEVLYELPSA